MGNPEHHNHSSSTDSHLKCSVFRLFLLYNIHAFQKIIQERQDLLCQIFSIQDEKLACCLTYDNLVNTYSYTQTNQIEKDLELREISQKLTSLSNQLEEAVSTLEQVNRTVNDHVNCMI